MQKEMQTVTVHVDPGIDIRKLNSDPLHKKLMRREAKILVALLKQKNIIENNSHYKVSFNNADLGNKIKREDYPLIEVDGEYFSIYPPKTN